MAIAEHRLPMELLSRASLSSNEYAWPLSDIPDVIESARQKGLLNVGGQLQFRLPDGGTCECHWVEVDTYKSVPNTLPWLARVDEAARDAAISFSRLKDKFDFVAEGRRGFSESLESLSTPELDKAMCFVWYVSDEQTELQRSS